MRRSLLNDGWTVRRKTNRFTERMGTGPAPESVTLPHDALIGVERSPSGDAATAFFPSGAWEYQRTLEFPPEDAGTSVSLQFEGVYRDASVYVNGSLAAHRPSGYADFLVPVDHLIRFGEPNELRVDARAHDDSRWYSGVGIYRSVWLLQAGPVHLVPDGVQVLTPEIDRDIATVTVAVEVCNRSAVPADAVIRTELRDRNGSTVTWDEAPVRSLSGRTVTVRRRLYVARPRRWGPDDPYLYTCQIALLVGADVIDQESSTFGIRSVSVDPARGLRINGKPVLLRGACLHHDNGPLGAATIDRAEERRVELLRAAGFNAIRSAHNPLSRPMIAACDRLGMLVMDEAFDMWEEPKSEDDYALRFPDWWEADVEAMVRKDINHPSVILYSIGNEIPEAGRPHGALLGRILAEKVRSLDGTRLVTQCISGLLVGGPELFTELRNEIDGTRQETDGETGVNTALTNLAERLNKLMLSPVVAAKSAETISYLDVAGYNYMESRYELDGTLYPNRVIVGSETHPAAIDTGWAEVERHPYLIGDFTWTGWDYLGEAGIGRIVYSEPGEPPPELSFMGEFPWLTAWCGDIDITGQRRPQSYYREIVFGLRSDPYVAVRRPQHHGMTPHSTPWSWSDSISSWSWEGFEGRAVTVEVYADADEVELVVNDRSLGRRPAGAAHRFTAEFETEFEPGLLEAVAWRAGRDIGRMVIRSATGPVILEAAVDRPIIHSHSNDLAFVELRLVDEYGVLHTSSDRRVNVHVEGSGVLQALCSANPANPECFTASNCTTFDGRALAVVRPTGVGTITLTASAEECDTTRVQIDTRD